MRPDCPRAHVLQNSEVIDVCFMEYWEVGDTLVMRSTRSIVSMTSIMDHGQLSLAITGPTLLAIVLLFFFLIIFLY